MGIKAIKSQKKIKRHVEPEASEGETSPKKGTARAREILRFTQDDGVLFYRSVYKIVGVYSIFSGEIERLFWQCCIISSSASATLEVSGLEDL